MTLEPDGQAAACKAVEVGSIPTGVSAHQQPVWTTAAAGRSPHRSQLECQKLVARDMRRKWTEIDETLFPSHRPDAQHGLLEYLLTDNGIC